MPFVEVLGYIHFCGMAKAMHCIGQTTTGLHQKEPDVPQRQIKHCEQSEWY